MRFSGTVPALVFACAILFAGCERAPNLKEPKTYSKHGVSFSYPGNWEITEEDREQVQGFVVRTVILETPGDSLMMLLSYRPPRAGATLKSEMESYIKGLADDVSATAKLGDVKLARVEALEARMIMSMTPGGEIPGIQRDFLMKALREKIRFRARLHILRQSRMEVMVIEQAEIADWKKVKPGYDFVLSKLKIKSP